MKKLSYEALWMVVALASLAAFTLIFAAVAEGQVTITGPTEPVPAGITILQVEGVDATTYGNAKLWIRPSEGVEARPITYGDDGTFALQVTTEQAGVYWFVLAVPSEDAVDGAEFELTIGEPKPDITPPDPIPDPTPGPGPKFVLILYESGDRTPGQAATMLGLRAWLLTSEHQWRMLDKDVKDSEGKTPEWLIPYLEAAKGHTLPAILISQPTDEGVGSVVVEAFPGTTEAAIEVVKGGK